MNSPHPRPLSPPYTSTDARTTSHSRPSHSPATNSRPNRYSEPGSQRQRRLLQSRNAKFPAKKLSLSNISSRFSQLIHATDEPEPGRNVSPDRNQENVSLPVHQTRSPTKRHSSGSSLGILDEITNTNVKRKVRKSVNIAIHEDNSSPERPLLERSPFSSPAAYRDLSSQGASPVEFDHIQDNLGSMRLREISGNEWRGSPLASSWNGSLKAGKQRKSFHVKSDSDTQEYIEHIEKELEAARKEMFSPATNKSLKEQLRSLQMENGRLRQDMDEIRITFEGEVKRTIEYKAEVEFELKRKVKDLEDELEQRDAVIRDLELQHDERRLNFSTIDTLKSAIERLEHEKLNLEDENRSITKRNEVLSELLAMSPTKMQSFELRSPTRERRAGRPMSLIIPRQPTSPSGRLLSHPPSANASPSMSSCGPFFSQFKSRTGSPPSSSRGLGLCGTDFDSMPINSAIDGHSLPDQRPSSKQRSRRSTLQSQGSISDGASVMSKASSPTDGIAQRVLPKRKPRKFMSGSTQLKPLLLPALNGDVPALSSPAAPSPQVEYVPRFQRVTDERNEYFPSDPIRLTSYGVASQTSESSQVECSSQDSQSMTKVYQSLEDIMAEQASSQISTHSRDSAPSSPSAFDDTILDYHVKSSHQEDLVNKLGADPYQNLEDYGIDDNVMSSPDHYGSLSHLPQSLGGLDLGALNNLGLPDPEYDDLPSNQGNKDGSLILDIPRPLFAFQALQDESLCRLSENASDRHGVPSLHRSCELTEFAPLTRAYSETDLANAKMNTLSARNTARSNVRIGDNLQSGQQGNPRRRAELPQRSSLRSVQSLDSRRNSLEVLCSSKFAGKPLASFAIRTLFRTISQCTRHVRDFKRDPLALARRILVNAWFSNWKLFGRLSWWVLGLFMSTGFGGPKLKKWEWDSFDAEEIARRACRQQQNGEVRYSANPEHSNALNYRLSLNKQDTDETNTETKEKVGWKKSITLWGKFSMAIMLAIGGAVVKGPGEMLKEIEGMDNKPGDTIGQPSQARMMDSRNEDHDTTFHHYPPTTLRHDQQPGRPPAQFASVPGGVTSPVNRAMTIIDHRNDTTWRSHRVVHADDEETLRAIKSPRKRVAGYFEHSYPASGVSYQPAASRAFQRQPPNSGFVTEPPDARAVLWPQSPTSSDRGNARYFRGNFF